MKSSEKGCSSLATRTIPIISFGDLSSGSSNAADGETRGKETERASVRLLKRDERKGTSSREAHT